MAKRKKDAIPKNDFASEEEVDVCSFSSSSTIDGNCVNSFSFDEDLDDDINVLTENKSINFNFSDTNTASANTTASNPKINTTSESNINANNNSISSPSPIYKIFDNRRTPIANGATPPIDGEEANIKRSYTLRASTIRKINELKSIHPDINVCVSSIVDIAIDFYHNYITNEGGNQ